MLEVALAEDRRQACDALRSRSVVMVGGEYAEELIPLYGLDPRAVQPVRAALRARDPHAARLVSDAMVEAFAIGGPESYVVERLQRLAADGLRSFIISPGKGADRATIEALGRVARGAFA